MVGRGRSPGVNDAIVRFTAERVPQLEYIAGRTAGSAGPQDVLNFSMCSGVGVARIYQQERKRVFGVSTTWRCVFAVLFGVLNDPRVAKEPPIVGKRLERSDRREGRTPRDGED